MKRFREFIGESSDRLIVYRGITTSDPAHATSARSGYNIFASSSPHVAASYAGEDGRVYALDITGMELIEFPVPRDKFGPRFDMFEFDRRARRLQPNQVLVARQVYDSGPRASTKSDPEKLYSYASDIYAIGNGSDVAIIA